MMLRSKIFVEQAINSARAREARPSCCFNQLRYSQLCYASAIAHAIRARQPNGSQMFPGIPRLSGEEQL